MHDSKTGYNLGFGVTAAGAWSSFGAEVCIAAGEVTRTRALEAGVRVVEELDLEIAGGSDSGEDSGEESEAEVVAPSIVRDQFAVGSGGFTGGDWGVDLSWAPIVDAQALHHAWSGGVVGVGGRVLEGARAAARDAAEPVMKLLRLGDEIIPVSSAIFSELEEDRVLRPAVAAGDTDELDEESDEKNAESERGGNSEQNFYELLAFKESSGQPTKVNRFGYLGLYQIGVPALIDGGYYSFDDHWTGKDGIYSERDFLDNPDIQTKAIKEYHKIIWNRYLKSHHHYEGTIVNGIKLTKSGMIAAAHLIGAKDFKNRFLDSGGVDVPRDGNNIPCTEYLKIFGGYTINFE